MHFIVSEWWKSMLYYISFHPEGKNKECVETYGIYNFDIMGISTSTAPATSWPCHFDLYLAIQA